MNTPASTKVEPDLAAGRFAQWPTSELAAQCRMQALYQPDPDFSAFMSAVAQRLATLTPAPSGEGREWMPIESAPKDGTTILVWGFDEEELDEALEEDRQPEACAFPARHGPQEGLWWLEGHAMRRIKRPKYWQPIIAPHKDTSHD